MANWRRPKLPGLAILTLLPFLCGALAYLIVVLPFQAVTRAGTWPEVACEITESRVDSYEVGAGRSRKIQREPVVRYRYQVEGASFEGSTIGYKTYAGMDPSAEAIRPYPKGLRTTCRVSPEDPSASVLDPSRDIVGTVVIITVFALAFLVVTSAAVYYWRQFFRLSPAKQ